jgi:hypothetical protein
MKNLPLEQARFFRKSVHEKFLKIYMNLNTTHYLIRTRLYFDFSEKDPDSNRNLIFQGQLDPAPDPIS